jgi:glycerophosphoryl diester phosphodiesterase
MIEEIVAAGAEARVFIQTYNLEDARTVQRLHPELMISTSIREEADLHALEAAGVNLDRVIGHTGSREPEDPSLYRVLRDRGMYTMVGTLGEMDREAAAGNPELYPTLVRNGATIISTDRPVEASEAMESLLEPGPSVSRRISDSPH